MEFKDFWGLYLFAFALAVFLWTVFVRFVFRIKAIIRNQVATVKLLEAIARASNVNEQTLKWIESDRVRSEPYSTEELKERELAFSATTVTK